MIDHDHDTEELRRIVDAEPLHHSGPDLGRLRTGGRSALRRRRAITGVAAFAAAAAIAAPAYVVVAGSSGGQVGGTTSGGPAGRPGLTGRVPSDPECGVFSCLGGEGRAERAPVVGEPWTIGELAGGAEEVLYVARDNGSDVVVAGVRDEKTLRRTVGALHPGANEMGMWSTYTADGSDQFSVVGYVAGTPEEINWSTPNGEQGGVTGTNSALLPGHTIFHLTLPLPDDFQRADYKESKKEGFIQIGPNDPFPELTISTSDGDSCSLAACGSLG